jgi:hypothetical protein
MSNHGLSADASFGDRLLAAPAEPAASIAAAVDREDRSDLPSSTHDTGMVSVVRAGTRLLAVEEQHWRVEIVDRPALRHRAPNPRPR